MLVVAAFRAFLDAERCLVRLSAAIDAAEQRRRLDVLQVGLFDGNPGRLLRAPEIILQGEFTHVAPRALMRVRLSLLILATLRLVASAHISAQMRHADLVTVDRWQRTLLIWFIYLLKIYVVVDTGEIVVGLMIR